MNKLIKSLIINSTQRKGSSQWNNRRNLCPGAKWVPGVIKKQLGSLTFLVEVGKGMLRKHHVDHHLTARSLYSKLCQVMLAKKVVLHLYHLTHLEIPTVSCYPERVRNAPDRFMWTVTVMYFRVNARLPWFLYHLWIVMFVCCCACVVHYCCSVILFGAPFLSESCYDCQEMTKCNMACVQSAT